MNGNRLYFLGALVALPFILAGCGTPDPFVQDWDRDRVSEIPDNIHDVQVHICFSHPDNTQQQVYQVGKEECAVRLREVLNLSEAQNTRAVTGQTQAEGRRFEGPVEREKRIQAMINSIKPVYIENDKWECPVFSPNRVTFRCTFNPNAQPAVRTQRNAPTPQVSPDLPPELPADLRPPQ